MPTQAAVPFVLPVHIAAGALAIIFGYVALYAAKGARLHRRSGLLFVVAMVGMSLTGALMAFLDTSPVSVVAGVLTFYFVTTALLTVRRSPSVPQWADAAAMLLAVIVAALAFSTGLETASHGSPEAAPMFIFGVVGLLAAAGDLRMIRAGGITGSRRIARHLWRMCFAMWVAAASFFWGPPGRVPEAINFPPLLAAVVLAPIGAMLYWLWRLRVRHSFRGITSAREPHAASLETP